jgi:hypothetical protein
MVNSIVGMLNSIVKTIRITFKENKGSAWIFLLFSAVASVISLLIFYGWLWQTDVSQDQINWFVSFASSIAATLPFFGITTFRLLREKSERELSIEAFNLLNTMTVTIHFGLSGSEKNSGLKVDLDHSRGRVNIWDYHFVVFKDQVDGEYLNDFFGRDASGRLLINAANCQLILVNINDRTLRDLSSSLIEHFNIPHDDYDVFLIGQYRKRSHSEKTPIDFLSFERAEFEPKQIRVYSQGRLYKSHSISDNRISEFCALLRDLAHQAVFINKRASLLLPSDAPTSEDSSLRNRCESILDRYQKK